MGLIMMDYRSSYALDKNGIDQDVSGTSAVPITANRVLWDLNHDVNLESSKFYPPLDGIWTLNGTVQVSSLSNCTQVAVQVWRNDELWFTVDQKTIGQGETRVALCFSCDMDCYFSSNHNFDVRIVLDGSSPSCTIDGSEDNTSWGASFRYSLDQASPT